jgi:hypothetical protein
VGGVSGTTTVYYSNGSLTLNAGSIPANGQKVILKVNGNLYIDGPAGSGVTYNVPASLASIPQLQVLVAGDITVSPNISRLDGFYDAQGSAGGGLNGGVFATCGDAIGPTKGAAAVANCRGRNLTVNGGVAAGIVMLNRTRGDRSGKYGQPQEPAETFVFSPQFWLPTGGSTKQVKAWQSVTSLPPIL